MEKVGHVGKDKEILDTCGKCWTKVWIRFGDISKSLERVGKGWNTVDKVGQRRLEKVRTIIRKRSGRTGNVGKRLKHV